MIATSTIHQRISWARWAGYGLSGLVVLFLVFDSGIKLLQLAPAVEATTALGYAASSVVSLGLIELVCVALYLFRPMAVLGAIVLTGYLGGAVAAQVRIDAPVFSLLFPIGLGALIWGGLLLRDPHLRALVPWRRPGNA